MKTLKVFFICVAIFLSSHLLLNLHVCWNDLALILHDVYLFQESFWGFLFVCLMAYIFLHGIYLFYKRFLLLLNFILLEIGSSKAQAGLKRTKYLRLAFTSQLIGLQMCSTLNTYFSFFRGAGDWLQGPLHEGKGSATKLHLQPSPKSFQSKSHSHFKFWCLQ